MKTTTLRRYMIAKTLWRLACEHDGIPTDSMFIEFRDENPWAVKLNAFNLEYPSNATTVFGDVIGFRLS